MSEVVSFSIKGNPLMCCKPCRNFALDQLIEAESGITI